MATTTTTTVTIRMTAGTARVAALLAPRPWDPDAGAIVFNGTTATVRRAYLPRLYAQMTCDRSAPFVKVAGRVRDAMGDAAPR